MVAPFRPRRPVVIGLLGGVASGKSTVARAFAAHGLRHIDADAEARRVTADPAVLAEVAGAFGRGVLSPDGTIDRQAMAALVFGDAAARARLEAITHPRIRQAILAALAAARTAGESVLLDVPLLLENGLIEACDVVVFVHASEATRQARAAARGWQPGELARREAAQESLASKRARATYQIDNDGPLEMTGTQVREILRHLERRG